jgi:putative hydrolase
VDPVAALERAAYLLERALAPTAKVNAFRRAAGVIAGLDDGELRSLVAQGRLTDLAGIGPSTGGVVADALSGGESPYLARLEATSAIPLGEGAALRATLRGDCHTHSTWSDGGATIAEMAAAARDVGHEWLVMSDHSPRMSVARGLRPERLAEQRREIDRLNDQFAPFRILQGMEVDINEDGSLDGPDDVLAGLDVVVASPHVKLRMDREAMTRRLVLAVANPHVDILGHCTGRTMGRERDGKGGRPPAQFDPDLVFAACARFDVAVEVNCRPERQDPPDELLAIALEYGCRLAIDTDAHARGQLEWQAYGCDKVVGHGVGSEQVVNARPLDEFVAWVEARTTAHA